MPGKRIRLMLLLLLLLVVASFVLTSCTITWDGDLSQEAGRRAREQVDQLIDQLGEFVVGFCGSSALPLMAIGLLLMLPAARRG